MAKHSSMEFKQQVIDYTFANFRSLAMTFVKLGAAYSAHDKWIRMANLASSSRRQV